MRKISLLLAAAACFYFSCNKPSGKPRILVFSKTTYYFHNSIPAGINAIIKLGQENNFDVDTTTNANWFNEDTLKKYSAVVFLNTADNKDALLNNYQEADFQRYIEAGEQKDSMDDVRHQIGQCIAGGADIVEGFRPLDAHEQDRHEGGKTEHQNDYPPKTENRALLVAQVEPQQLPKIDPQIRKAV